MTSYEELILSALEEELAQIRSEISEENDKEIKEFPNVIWSDDYYFRPTLPKECRTGNRRKIYRPFYKDD